MDRPTIDEFRAVRRHLKAHRAEIAEAVRASDGEAGDADGHGPRVLTRTGWIPPRPLAVNEIRLALRAPTPEEDLEPARRRVASELGIDGYARFVEAHDRPGIWFDAPVYRLMDVEPDADGTLDLRFAIARYFDSQDTAEPLLYEAARRDLQGRPDVLGGPYRAWLADPFDLRRRCALPGISTLTVRAAADGASFLMHQRGQAGVGGAMNAVHVVPAGEFQPHVDNEPMHRSDLSIVKAVLREYAEELLGVPDAAGDDAIDVDYDRDEPFAAMTGALADGTARLRVLGVGLEPLTWKPEILTVCVWDAEVFDALFAGIVDENEEGTLVLGERTASGAVGGIPFSEKAIADYIDGAETFPIARACLALAWRWRAELGIVP